MFGGIKITSYRKTCSSSILKTATGHTLCIKKVAQNAVLICLREGWGMDHKGKTTRWHNCAVHENVTEHTAFSWSNNCIRFIQTSKIIYQFFFKHSRTSFTLMWKYLGLFDFFFKSVNNVDTYTENGVYNPKTCLAFNLVDFCLIAIQSRVCLNCVK